MSDVLDSIKIEKEELRFQYDKLRTEILQNEMVGLQLLGATLVLVAALIGYALRAETGHVIRSLIFTGCSIVSSLALIQTFGRVRSTFLMASYIRNFIEPHTTHLKWESRLEKFRANQKKPKFKSLDSFMSSYILIICAIAILSIGYAVKSSPTLDAQSWTTFPFLWFDIKYSIIVTVLACINILILIWSIVWKELKYEKYVTNHKFTYDTQWQQANEDLAAELGRREPVTITPPATPNVRRNFFQSILHRLFD